MTSNHHTPFSTNDPLTAIVLNAPLGELDSAISDDLTGDSTSLAVSTLTIVAGAVTRTGRYHTIATEGSASIDNLNTINGGVDGNLLTIRGGLTGDTVVVGDVNFSGGNIRLANGKSRSLRQTHDTITLIYDGTISEWVEIAPNTDNQRGRVGWLKSEKRIESDFADATKFVGVGLTLTQVANALANFRTTTGVLSQMQTSAVLNNQAYLQSANLTIVDRNNEATLEFIFARDTIGSSFVRYWLGFFSVLPTADDPTGNLAAFRFSSAAGDTGVRPCTKDGTTLNVGANMGTFGSGIGRYRIEMLSDRVNFHVAGEDSVALTTNLPNAATGMGIIFLVETLVTAVRDLNLGTVLLMHN